MRLIRLLAIFACFATAMAQIAIPTGEPGDVFLIDRANAEPFLWIHASTGRMEPMPGFKPEQVYRLLLEREQACWAIHQELAQHVIATIVQKPSPIIPIR